MTWTEKISPGAGEASVNVKKQLRQMGFPPEVIRRVSIAVCLQGEINMVIHAGGGQADVAVAPDKIEITLTDHGPGIADISLAMKEGYSTAPDHIRSLGFGAGMGLPQHEKIHRFHENRIGRGRGNHGLYGYCSLSNRCPNTQ